ncbi:MAG: efflux RND transporter periplasmic adaptor subunit [Acidobacteria bacterium]|nr:efflux RND transporter periplasmic adaptor subunit [Acidobacteriota bacterium]
MSPKRCLLGQGWLQVKLNIEAYPGREFTGKISRINPSVDEKNRTFEIEALVANHSGELKPGSFVKAVIESNKIDSIITIPANSTVYLFGTYKVFVVQGNRIKEREVKLGDRLGDRLEIIEGLQPDERIAFPRPVSC